MYISLWGPKIVSFFGGEVWIDLGASSFKSSIAEAGKSLKISPCLHSFQARLLGLSAGAPFDLAPLKGAWESWELSPLLHRPDLPQPSENSVTPHTSQN